jgi:hypothetical protein
MADELTLDQLHGIPTDPEAEKKVAQAQQLPVGTYNSVPELQPRVYTADDGRRNVKYFGQFLGTGELVGVKGFTSFWVSPDDRFKDDGKPDLKTRLMNQAVKVYRLAHGIAPTQVVDKGDVLTYLQKYSVAVRFIQGDDTEIGVAISAAKE